MLCFGTKHKDSNEKKPYGNIKQKCWTCAIDGHRYRICDFVLGLKTKWWIANMLKIPMKNYEIDNPKYGIEK